MTVDTLLQFELFLVSIIVTMNIYTFINYTFNNNYEILRQKSLLKYCTSCGYMQTNVLSDILKHFINVMFDN